MEIRIKREGKKFSCSCEGVNQCDMEMAVLNLAQVMCDHEGDNDSIRRLHKLLSIAEENGFEEAYSVVDDEEKIIKYILGL